MVSRDQLVAAFGVWTGTHDRSMAEVLTQDSALDPEEQALLTALVEKHLKRYSGDPEKSLAALELGPSRESLARIGAPDVQASLARLGTGSDSTERPPKPTPTAPPATRWARPPARARTARL
jgi:hypothetical protein